MIDFENPHRPREATVRCFDLCLSISVILLYVLLGSAAFYIYKTSLETDQVGNVADLRGSSGNIAETETLKWTSHQGFQGKSYNFNNNTHSLKMLLNGTYLIKIAMALNCSQSCPKGTLRLSMVNENNETMMQCTFQLQTGVPQVCTDLATLFVSTKILFKTLVEKASNEQTNIESWVLDGTRTVLQIVRISK